MRFTINVDIPDAPLTSLVENDIRDSLCTIVENALELAGIPARVGTGKNGFPAMCQCLALVRHTVDQCPSAR